MEVKVHGLIKKVHSNFTLEIANEMFPTGSVTALVGPNGKGKTTFLNILAGLDNEFTGEITYDGKHICQQVRERITMTFQTPMLLDRTVYANVEYPLKIRGVPYKERKEQTEALLQRLSIEHLAKKNAKKLSGGESQKVALARGLALKPQFLLLDEPFSAIDHQTIQDMLECIADYNKATGATVILVSHDSGQVETLCGRAIGI